MIRMENSIGRNKIMHTHEIVHQLMHWWDDVVFEKYTTWFDCLESEDRAVKFNRSDLEAYFGPQESGIGHYTQSVKYGIGHEVIAKMLSGAEKQSDIKEALTALEPTTRVLETDPTAYVLSANVHRRHLTKGQQAMAVALAYPEPTNKGGRGKKAETPVIITEVSNAYLAHARFVLRNCRDKAEEVLQATESKDKLPEV